MKSDDIVPFLTGNGPRKQQADVGFRQGTCIAIDRSAGTNTILIAGQEMHDLPILNPAATVILPGDYVALLRAKSTYLILAKIWSPGQGTYAYWPAGAMTPGASQWDTWPSTTSGSYTELLAADAVRLSTGLSYSFATYVGPNTSGVFQLTANGVEIANSGTYTGGTAGAIGVFGGLTDWPDTAQLGEAGTLAVNAKVTSGTGKVAAVHRFLNHLL